MFSSYLLAFVFGALVDLVFPNLCRNCERYLNNRQEFLCLKCRLDMPRTRFGLAANHPVAKVFRGRFPLPFATSWLYFENEGMVRNLIHKIKYEGDKDLALKLGFEFGKEWLHSNKNLPFDFIIPVPLHPKKFKKRGYNQAQIIAQGIAEATGKIMRADILQRGVYKESQTNHSRSLRWINVSNNYYISNIQGIANKRIILIDDVITTGATLEACLKCFENIPGVQCGIGTLAFVK